MISATSIIKPLPYLLRFFILFKLFSSATSEISSSSDLNCDFSTSCRWRNSSNGEDNGDWMIGKQIDVEPTRQIRPMKEGDLSEFAFTGGLMGRTQAFLVSDVITCQLGGANIKYWYYKTGQDSQLELCIRQPPGNRDPATLRCYDGLSSTYAQQWIFRVIELPPISQPFELIFRATYFPPSDIVALDDIFFDAALCEISNSGANQGAGGNFGEDDSSSNPKLVDFTEGTDVAFNQDFRNVQRAPTSNVVTDDIRRPLSFAAPTAERSTSAPAAPAEPRRGPMYTPLCSLTDCTFDENTFCNYVTSVSSENGVNGTLRDWTISARGVLNSLTGVPHDLSKTGSFLYAGGTDVNSKETFILSSNIPVDIKETSRLDFFVYQAGVKGRLRVCIDTLTDCPLTLHGKEIELDSRRWKNYNVNLVPGRHAIHFVADRLHANYVIGLDQIQLLNKYGMNSQAC